MTLSNVEDLLQKQSCIFYYPRWVRLKNTIFIIIVYLLLIKSFSRFVAEIPYWFFILPEKIVFHAIILGYLAIFMGYPIFVLYRLYTIRRHWHDLFIVTSNGICKSNKYSGNQYYRWKDFVKIRSNFFYDELRLITANRKNTLRIDKTLKHYSNFKTLVIHLIE